MFIFLLLVEVVVVVGKSGLNTGDELVSRLLLKNMRPEVVNNRHKIT